MRLINPGAGELSDRLTILQLKILFGEEAEKDVAHFRTESTALLSQIRSRTLNGAWFAAVLELAAVNAVIWHAEDDLRAYRVQPDGKPLWEDKEARTIVGLAFRIQALNDQRGALIEQINRDSGEGGAKEKLT